MVGLSLDFKQIVEKASDIIIVTKADVHESEGPEIVYVNEAFTRLTGYSFEEAVGNTPRMLQGPDTSEDAKKLIRNALNTQTPTRVNIKNYSKDGRAYWLDLSIHPLTDADGEVTHFVAVEREITNQKKLERKLKRLSRIDPLTACLNRRAFDELLKVEYSKFKRKNCFYTALMIDVDHFKKVNDQHGHHVGDLVLRNLARRLLRQFRDHDVVARVGGEEFCVLLLDTRTAAAAESAERLRKKINARPLVVESLQLEVSISIGVAEVSLEDSGRDDILKRADKALYEAKADGRNIVRCAQHDFELV